jgi:3-oxoacyl-[acyl-carrier-protein] synthase III
VPESGADDDQRLHPESPIYNVAEYPEIHGDLNLEIFESALRHVISQVDAFHLHVAADGMATSELAVEAGQQALKSGLVESVDALILATTTPGRRCPATVPEVAAKLGLGAVPAFDVAAVCSEFIYALANGAGLITAGTADQVLVMGAEVFSSILDPRDHTTRAIFGDGVGAVVFRAGEPHELGAVGAAPFTPSAVASPGAPRWPEIE